MSFTIIRNDIAAVRADAIVNAANHAPVIGSGVDARLHLAAGPLLLEARKKIGFLSPGEAAVTQAFALPARFVIHAVTPHWENGAKMEAQLLRRAYDRCLELAVQQDCRSIAFPLLAAGHHGFPRELALRIATSAFRDFLEKQELEIILVVFDRESFQISKARFLEVSACIDDALAETTAMFETLPESRDRNRNRYPRQACALPDESAVLSPSVPAFPTISSSPAPDLQELLREQDAGFAETLVSLIEKSGKKNSEIYKKANVDKKLFSKIVNNIHYHPSKPTAVAFAIALELDLEQTKDLIGRAGFALTHSSKFDIIIEYFIRNHNYDLFEINEVLFSFDQVLLGV